MVLRIVLLVLSDEPVENRWVVAIPKGWKKLPAIPGKSFVHNAFFADLFQIEIPEAARVI
jgi:hypothetical protein